MLLRLLLRGGAILAALTVSACASLQAPPSRADDACAIFAEKQDWWRAVKQAERRWGVPPAFQLAVIGQESSFTHDARPPLRGGFLIFPGQPASSAYGFAQALDGTWAQYQKAAGAPFAQRDRFEDAADFIGWYFAESRRRLRLSPDAYQQHYLAYHEGHGGYERRTFQSKSWLLDVASKVERRTQDYRAQLSRCEGRLNGGGFWLF